MQKLVFTNGDGQTIDLTSGNFGITNWEGLSGVGLNIQVQQVPFQDGGVFLDALMEQREISVTVAIQDNNDLSARYERKRQLISALNPKLGEGVLVYTNDYLSRQIKAVPQLPIFENKNSNDAGTLKASVVFSCSSPYWEDLEETVVELGGITKVENKGDVPTDVIILIPSGTINPSIGNRRNGKQIALTGSYENEIEINTNVGEKSVTSKEVEFTWVEGGTFRSITYGKGKYVYVGTQIVVEELLTGKIYSASCDSFGELYSVIFSNNMFIAVGSNGYILTSTDGITWTKRTSGVSVTLYGVAYGNNMFVAVGANVKILTSADGITWTTVQTGGGALKINAITFGNNLFVAAGESGFILTSPDGENWSVRTSGVGDNLCCVVYENSQYLIGTQYGAILTSADGITWTRKYSGYSPQIESIAYGDDLYVAVSERNIITSTDGITWTKRTDWNIYLYSIIYCNGLFVVVGLNGTIATSVNGIDWEIALQSVPVELGSAAYGNNLFVAISSNYPKAFTSIDGKTWEESATINSAKQISFINDKFIAVGNNGNIAISQNGISWTLGTVGVQNGLTNITLGNDKYVIVGTSGTILTSTDLANWTVQTSGVSVALYGVAYGNNMFIAVGINGTVLKSLDGITWSVIENVTTYNLNNIILVKKMFVAVGDYGTILTSKDGENWERKTTNVYEALVSIIYGKDRFVAIGSSTIITSSDGNSWIIKNKAVNYGMNRITYGKNIFVIVGLYGLTINSYTKSIENLISQITSESDMTFNLETGNNQILYTNNNDKSATLKYRQKYIGV